jgi:hypothetical protein
MQLKKQFENKKKVIAMCVNKFYNYSGNFELLLFTSLVQFFLNLSDNYGVSLPPLDLKHLFINAFISNTIKF